MKAWVATGLVLLVAGAAVAVLLVDPHLWRSEGQMPMHTTIRVARGQRPQPARRHRKDARPESPYALRPAPRNLPVNVRFASANEPSAGVLFNVHTGRGLWGHDPGRRLPTRSLTRM